MVYHLKGRRQAAGGDDCAGAETDLGILVALAFSAFVADLRASIKAQGFPDLHPSFGYVARNLAEAPLTVSELAERMDITSPGALKIVKQLEETGYVERSADPDDARAKRMRLTRRGRAALAAARAFHARFEQELTERHGAAAVRSLRKVLGDVVARHEAGGSPLAVRPV